MTDRQLQAITLCELQRRIQARLIAPELRDVWVMAELSDVRVSGGHCYMELLQKEEATGRIVAKSRAAAWANVYRSISANFRKVTGCDFASGIKVMLRLSVSYHEAYGMTLVVSDVNPEFTMGDLLRRRRENILRLQREGILDLNRKLKFPRPTLRIAVVSARGAAGYGDFVNQLFSNSSKLAFRLALFPARLQGEGTTASIIDALRRIAASPEGWDCVVIIRGGGASSDLIAFEDYDLAAAIARFPLPVIIGIGHERDITLLDYVANMRVKTPTAAAEWLIAEGEKLLDMLRRVVNLMMTASTARIGESARRLSSLETLLAVAPTGALERRSARLRSATISLCAAAGRISVAMDARLKQLAEAVERESQAAVKRNADRITSLERLVEAYSPVATLRRGYSVTRRLSDGAVVRSVADLRPGDSLTTAFVDGESISTITTLNQAGDSGRMNQQTNES